MKRWLWNKAGPPPKVTQADSPTEDIPARIIVAGQQFIEYTALQTFEKPELQAIWKAGSTYRLKVSGQDHPRSDAARLKALLPTWEAAGMIEIMKRH